MNEVVSVPIGVFWMLGALGVLVVLVPVTQLIGLILKDVLLVRWGFRR